MLHNYGHLLFPDVTEGVSVNRAATAACLSVAHRFTPGGGGGGGGGRAVVAVRRT